MNDDLPFEDWEIDLESNRKLRFRFVPTRKQDLSPLRINDKRGIYAERTPVWIELSSAKGFQFVLKKNVYQKCLDVGRFLNNIFHFRYLHPSTQSDLIFTDLHPYVMCECCKYLHWKYKYGDVQERPVFISNQKLFLQVLEAAKKLRIQVSN